MLLSKPPSRGRFGKYCLAFAVAVCFFAALPSRAASGGSISGTVSDPSEALPAQVKTPFGASDKAYSSQLSGTVVDTSGAVIAGATVTGSERERYCAKNDTVGQERLLQYFWTLGR